MTPGATDFAPRPAPDAMSESVSARPRNSLRGQLTMLVIALALPLLLLQGWWSYHDYRGARERAEADALAFADATALGVQQFFSAAEELMLATARQYGTHGPDNRECAVHMRNMKQTVPFLSNALAIDADGRIVCSFLEAAPDATATSWPWWTDVRDNPRFLTGDPVEGDFTGTWILPLVVPIMNEGSFDGAIVGTVELTELGRLFGGVATPETHLVTVATADRVVLARSSEAEDRVGQSLPALTGSDREVGPGRWVATGVDLEGIERTWGQVELAGGWIVYVGVPDAIVYGPALREALSHVGTTLLVLLLGMLLAAGSYRRIADSLRELAVRTGATRAGSLVPLPDGAPTEVTEIVEQFNETLRSRDEAQAAERRAHQRLQVIFDNAVFGISVTTPEGRILQANPALVSMLGYPSESALIEAGALALYPRPDERAALVAVALATGTVEAHEVEWMKADGSAITVRISGNVIEGGGGEPAIETIVQDITDEKRREEELRQTQKMDAIGQLAGGVAHDFNNLLTVIGGNVELLEDSLGVADPLRTDLAQIAKATHRAASLTRRLLSFSRATPPGTQILDVNQVVPELTRMLVPVIGEEVSLELDLEEGPHQIAIDPGELEQTVLNLVLNARDAMPNGGRIGIATRHGRKVEAGSDPGSEAGDGQPMGVVLTVSDTGSGIAEAIKPRIFEPFFTTKPMGEGTGLGLSTVYGIVKRGGGSISVESQPDTGTTLRLWFPAAESSVAPGPIRTPIAESGNEAIVVVEDDELVRTFVERALSEAGYDVRAAASADEALALLDDEARPIDLILTDIVMPGMSGVDFAKHVTVIRPDVRLLFMSGYVQNALAHREFRNDPDRLLRKPFAAHELRARVRLALDGATVGSRAD